MIKIRNATGKSFDLIVTTESNDGFVFSGPRSFTMRVLPFQTEILRMNCWPIAAGYARLPIVKASFKRLDSDQKEMVQAELMTTWINPRY